MSGMGLVLLILVQGKDAEVLEKAGAVAEQACELDPDLRIEAEKEARALVKKHEAPVFRLGQSSKEERRIPAQIVMTLAGKFPAEKLFAQPDSRARQVACDLLPEPEKFGAELVALIHEKNVGLRLAACRALGRIKDAAARGKLQSQVQTAGDPKKFDVFDILSMYISSIQYPQSATSLQYYINYSDAEMAEVALAALCSTPSLEPGANFETNASGVLRKETVDLKLRKLLLKRMARCGTLAEMIGMLTLPNRELRSEVVRILDEGLKDKPLLAKPLIDMAKNEAVKKLDDGREPPRPIPEWIEEWLKRLTGQEGGIEKHEEWVQVKYRSLVDKMADEAIKKGVEFLKKTQKEDGTWSYNGSYPVGVTALVVYTMLKSDVPVEDSSLSRGLEHILAKDPEGNYSVALVAMALATAIDKLKEKKKTTGLYAKLQSRLQEIVDIIVASQKPGGGWHYDIRLKTGTGVQQPNRNQDSYDFSNTQFSVLGLRAAANAGARVPRPTWERALALYEKHHNSGDGGWPYIGMNPDPSRPATKIASSMAMTAASAYGWMICKTSLNEKLSSEMARDDERIVKALGYLEKNWKVDSAGIGDAYYWLYSLERFCMAGKLERIGTHDWYHEGAVWLLARQKLDGSWSGNHGATVDSCFAILFLKRAFVATPFIESGSVHKKEKKSK